MPCLESGKGCLVGGRYLLHGVSYYWLLDSQGTWCMLPLSICNPMKVICHCRQAACQTGNIEFKFVDQICQALTAQHSSKRPQSLHDGGICIKTHTFKMFVCFYKSDSQTGCAPFPHFSIRVSESVSRNIHVHVR